MDAVNILIISGEESGDLHGSALMKEMKSINSNLVFYGIGGDRMIAEGLNHSFHIKDMSFLGIVEVIKHLPYIMKVKKTILKLVGQKRIKTVVLIDYPGFNLNLARRLNTFGLRIMYYISPQIWAWGTKRIEKIKKLITKMLVVFPFEKEFYLSNGVDVEFVGHPLIERINKYQYMSKNELFDKFDLDKNKEILLIMPGSRKHEIEKIFPESYKAAEQIAERNNMQIVVACAQNIDENYFSEMISGKVITIKNCSYDLMQHSKFGIVKSGTSTLECALHELPFVVVYRTSPITYFIGERLVNVDLVAMPNIIAGEKVVEEFIQNNLTSENLVESVNSFLDSEDEQIAMIEKFKHIKSLLGEGNASLNAARIIIDEMDEIRKKTKVILQFIGNYLLHYAAVVLCKSLRVRTKNFENLKSLLKTDNLVVAFWHGTMIIPWFYFRKYKMSALVSASKDGELLYRVLKKWKYNVQRGSSSRGGKDALEKLINLAEKKYSVAITPDGPGGPVFEMKPGAVIVSKKSQIPLIMVGIGMNKKWTLKSWDSFEIPKFFSRVNIVVSDPMTINAELTYDETSDKILECEKILNQLQAEASVFA